MLNIGEVLMPTGFSDYSAWNLNKHLYWLYHLMSAYIKTGAGFPHCSVDEPAGYHFTHVTDQVGVRWFLTIVWPPDSPA